MKLTMEAKYIYCAMDRLSPLTGVRILAEQVLSKNMDNNGCYVQIQ